MRRLAISARICAKLAAVKADLHLQTMCSFRSRAWLAATAFPTTTSIPFVHCLDVRFGAVQQHCPNLQFFTAAPTRRPCSTTIRGGCEASGLLHAILHGDEPAHYYSRLVHIYPTLSAEERHDMLQQLASLSPVILVNRLRSEKNTDPLLWIYLREDLLAAEPHPHLDTLHAHVKDYLQTALLDASSQHVNVVRINETSSSDVLQYLVENEAVHPVTNVADFIQERLAPSNKLVYGLFVCDQDVPAFVLYVSLQERIPCNLEEIWDPDHSVPTTAAATFYSISNLQPALSGIGLGELLIQTAVKHLQREHSIFAFATLSPLPGFRTWVIEQSSRDEFVDILGPSLIEQVTENWTCQRRDVGATLLKHLSTDVDVTDVDVAGYKHLHAVVNVCLERLAAHYIYRAKGEDDRPLDGVARFHLANGAQVYRINVGANPGNNSFGVMVNYRYNLPKLSENQESFPHQIDVHENVANLLKDTGSTAPKA
jgi:Malonyl-CoA decarboxylase C-terminal domain